MHHLDELFDHLLGDDEVGNHAVLHRADGSMLPGTLPSMAFGLVAHGLDHLLPWGRFRGGWHHEGSSSTMPLSRAKIRVLAVPGRWQDRWRDTDGKLRTFKNPLGQGRRFGLPSPVCGIQIDSIARNCLPIDSLAALCGKGGIIPHPL